MPLNKMKTQKETKQKTKEVKPTRIELDKNANIAETVSKYPEAAEIFAAFGLHCTSCFASQFDTITQGAKLHGMLDEEIEEMIEEANKVINNEDTEYDIS
jgi:hybrid cluster-associated redox disulfide protein